MRILEDLRIREIAGRKVAYTGKSTAGERQALCLSNSACWLLEQLKGKDFTVEDAVRVVCGHFDVDPDTAGKDVSQTLELLQSINVVG